MGMPTATIVVRSTSIVCGRPSHRRHARASVLDVPKGDGEGSKRGVAVEIIDLSSDDDVNASIVVETTTAIAGGDDDGEETALDNPCNKLDCFDSVEKEEAIAERISMSVAANDASAVDTSDLCHRHFLDGGDSQFVIDEEGLKELGGDDDNVEEVVGVADRSKLGAFDKNDETPSAVPRADLGQVEGGEPISPSYTSDVTNVRTIEICTIFDVYNDDGSDDDVVVVKNGDIDKDDDDDSADKLSSYCQRHDRYDATSGRNNYRMDVAGRASSSSSVILLDHDDSSEEKEYLGCDSSDSDADSEFPSRSRATNPRR
jgi:hypothetical protein